MADYWKSQDRKYCDFCKCWIADNKPSIEFHEKGRRHKENVSKRLKAIQKKSRRDEKETVRIDAALQHMEAAALEAYRKDVESNADLTSIAINKKVQEDNLEISSGKKIWHEAKSDSGQTYYWNILTNESIWEPPSEGYLSIVEQKEAANELTKKQMKNVQKHQQMQGRLRLEEEKKHEEEERARAAREKLKERRVEDLPPVIPVPIILSGKSTPYGRWQTVKTDIPVVDLQLPQQALEFEVPVIPEPEPEPAPREFKEKVVESLGSGNTEFKKRKIGAVARRNTRQRLDDE